MCQSPYTMSHCSDLSETRTKEWKALNTRNSPHRELRTQLVHSVYCMRVGMGYLKKKKKFPARFICLTFPPRRKKGKSLSISVNYIEKCLLPGLAWKRCNYHNRHEQYSHRGAFNYKPKLLGQVLEDGDSLNFPLFSLF